MNIDDIHMLVSIESEFMNDIEDNSSLIYKTFNKATINKVCALIMQQKPQTFDLLTRLLCLMKYSQLHKVFGFALKRSERSLVEYLKKVSENSTPNCVKLKSKVNFLVMHALLKNTLVDVNVVELKKTIKAHEKS